MTSIRDPGVLHAQDLPEEAQNRIHERQRHGEKFEERGWDFYNNDNNPQDDHFHGTHCAGMIGALGNNGSGVVGVCWRVSILPPAAYRRQRQRAAVRRGGGRGLRDRDGRETDLQLLGRRPLSHVCEQKT